VETAIRICRCGAVEQEDQPGQAETILGEDQEPHALVIRARDVS
jgi:hypothetical protein